jgi:hypothetical protein
MSAMGLVQDGDTSLKAGKWQYFETGDWKIREVIYSKAITMSVMNQLLNDDSRDFSIKVLENGSWREPVIDEESRGRCIYITEKTDSIIAFRDRLSYGFRLPYQEIRDNIQMQFYLLKPGERTLKIGYYKTPFKTIKDSYVIIPDYSLIKDKNKTTDQITDSMIAKLQKQYPELMPIYISKRMRGISLQGMGANEKRKLLLQLEGDKTIQFVCRLFAITDREVPTYCNNSVYVELKGNDPEPLRKAAAELGFVDLRADIGSNRYWLSYKSKMIDEGFFDAYRRLTETPWVLSAYFNTYMDAEPDSRVRPAEAND